MFFGGCEQTGNKQTSQDKGGTAVTASSGVESENDGLEVSPGESDVSVGAVYEGPRANSLMVLTPNGLCFYDIASRDKVNFSADTARVYGFVYDKNSDLLYYTVSNNDTMMLKAIPLSEEKACLEVLANFKVTKESCHSAVTGHVAPIFPYQGKIVQPTDFSWDSFSFNAFACYDSGTGKTNKTDVSTSLGEKLYSFYLDMDDDPEGGNSSSRIETEGKNL